MGLFDVNMPLIYGEGAEKAFIRLQHKILKNSEDESIFAWWKPEDEEYSGLLATKPAYYAQSGKIQSHGTLRTGSEPTQETSRGIRVSRTLEPMQHDLSRSIYFCGLRCESGSGKVVVLVLRRVAPLEPRFIRVLESVYLDMSAELGMQDVQISSEHLSGSQGRNADGEPSMAFAVEFFASIAKPYESFFVLDRYMNQDCLDVRWTVRYPEILGNPYEMSVSSRSIKTYPGAVKWAFRFRRHHNQPSQEEGPYIVKHYVQTIEIKLANQEFGRPIRAGGESSPLMTYLLLGEQILPDSPFGHPAPYSYPFCMFAPSVSWCDKEDLTGGSPRPFFRGASC